MLQNASKLNVRVRLILLEMSASICSVQAMAFHRLIINFSRYCSINIERSPSHFVYFQLIDAKIVEPNKRLIFELRIMN